jgi:FkbM family methyltransferase
MSFKRKLIAHLNRTSIIDNHIYTAKHGPAKGLKRQGGMGWLPSFIPRMHEWDAEEAFLAGLGWNGLTVYDVGGDQGLFTLFFAKRVGEGGRVIVFEPNPHSLRRIEQNIRLNDFSNVKIMPLGLGEKIETLQFTFPSSEPARGTAIPSIADQIKCETDTATCEIQVSTLDHEISQNDLPVPDFIKMDIEGMEYSALKGMQETLQAHHPRLSIEMHGAGKEEKVESAGHVVALLEDAGYKLRHIESGEDISKANAEMASEGHIYCEPS